MVPGFRSKEIKSSKSVGQRLRQARKKKQITLEAAEQLTKVKLKYLRALEEDHYDQLPTEVYTLGFLRCYGEVLNLNTRKLLTQYQSEHRSVRHAKGHDLSPIANKPNLQSPRFVVTPKILVITSSIVIVLGLVLYIASGIQSFLAPPELTIDQPKADSRITSNTVTVSGITDPSASLSINGETITLTADGKFTKDVAVVPGLNTLDLVSINRVGKQTHEVRKILADYQVAIQTNIPSTPNPEPTPSPTVSPSPIVTTSPSPMKSQ